MTNSNHKFNLDPLSSFVNDTCWRINKILQVLFFLCQTFGKSYKNFHSCVAHFSHWKHFGQVLILKSFTSPQNKFRRWDCCTYGVVAPIARISRMINDVWRKNGGLSNRNVSQTPVCLSLYPTESWNVLRPLIWMANVQRICCNAVLFFATIHCSNAGYASN